MKSSFGNSHRKRNKEKSKRKSREKEEALQADVQQQMEHCLASFESKPSCCELPVEEVVRDEPESIVELKTTQALEVSLLNETRREHATVGALLCNCEGCVKVSQDQGLEELLGLGMGQVVTMDCDKKRGSSSRDDKGNGCYTLPCSGFQNVFFYGISHSDFEMESKGGKIYDLLTPHFHYFMLIRLMVGLVNMVVIMMLIIRENDVLCLDLYKLSIMEKRFCFMLRKCHGLKFLGVNIMNVAVSNSRLCRMYLSRWSMTKGNEIKQKTFFCFTINVLILRGNMEFNCLKGILTYHLNGLKHVICLKERGMSCIKVKHRVCSHGLRSHLNATQHFDFYYALVSITREFGCHVHCATVVRPRNFMVIFDPGGVCVKPSLGAAFEHESA